PRRASRERGRNRRRRSAVPAVAPNRRRSHSRRREHGHSILHAAPLSQEPTTSGRTAAAAPPKGAGGLADSRPSRTASVGSTTYDHLGRFEPGYTVRGHAENRPRLSPRERTLGSRLR